MMKVGSSGGMKKLFVLLILSVLVLIPITPVFAGVASHATTKAGDAIDITLHPIHQLPQKFGYDITGDIIPIVAAVEKRIAIPDVYPFAVFNKALSDLAQSIYGKQKTIDFTNNNPVSAKYCVKMVLTPPYMEKVVRYDITDTTTEISADWPDSRVAGQAEEYLASWNGLWKKGPNTAGYYDYNYPTHVIATIVTGDCGMQTSAVPVKTGDPLVAKQLARFEPGCPDVDHCSHYEDWYSGPEKKYWVEGDGIKPGHWEWVHLPVPIRYEITRKSGDGHFTNLQAKSGRCDSGDTSDAQTAALCDQRGQWTSGFVPKSIFDIPIAPHAQVEQQVQLSGITAQHISTLDHPVTLDTAFKNTHSAMEDTKTAVCFLTPMSRQNAVSIGDKTDSIPLTCNVRAVKCPIDVILDENPQSKDNSCSLCNTGSYTSSDNFLTPAEKLAFPGGVPPALVKVLRYAGGVYHVPPAVLLGTMLEEGAFEHAPSWTWTDTTVRTYSDCTIKDPMPRCDEFAHPTTGAKGAFGFIQFWWDQSMAQLGEFGPFKPLADDPLFKDVLANRPKDTMGSCNFLDAAMMAAQDMGTTQSHLYVPGVPQSCSEGTYGTTTYPIYQGGDIPGSCSVWESDRVALTRYQYSDRVCDATIGRTVRTFDAFNCSTDAGAP